MNRIAFIFVLLVSAAAVQADTMTLASGQVIKGRLTGFDERKFTFQDEDGLDVSEYPINIKSIIPSAPIKVTANFIRKQYEDAEFCGYENFNVRLTNGKAAIMERVIMLKELKVNRPGEPGKLKSSVKADAAQKIKTESTEPVAPPREWQRSGKWREMESNSPAIISQGEDVDIDNFLRKGFVNIVHFHYPKDLASVREGNYIEVLAAKPANKLVILKVVALDFKAPICDSLGIKSLPQFWFYDSRGRLVKKLTDRFTEGDIDGALKQARH